MPAEGWDLRWKGWRKGAGSREWPTAYHPGDEQECPDVITCTSEGDDPRGRRPSSRVARGTGPGAEPSGTAKRSVNPAAAVRGPKHVVTKGRAAGPLAGGSEEAPRGDRHGRPGRALTISPFCHGLLAPFQEAHSLFGRRLGWYHSRASSTAE